MRAQLVAHRVLPPQTFDWPMPPWTMDLLCVLAPGEKSLSSEWVGKTFTSRKCIVEQVQGSRSIVDQWAGSAARSVTYRQECTKDDVYENLLAVKGVDGFPVVRQELAYVMKFAEWSAECS